MKKLRTFMFASPLGLGGVVLAVVLSGCETPPPAGYPAGSTEYISTQNGGPGVPAGDDVPPPVHTPAPAPSPERVAGRHPQLSPAKTPSISSTPAKLKPAGVESEVRDPSDLKADDTSYQKKGGDKKPTPAKVDAEIPNPSDLH